MCKEASITVIDIVADLVDQLEDLNRESSVFFGHVIELFVHILQRNQANSVVLVFLEYLRLFLEKYKEPLFTFKHTANDLSNLVSELIRMCNSNNDTVLKEASVLLYLFLKVIIITNFFFPL